MKKKLSVFIMGALLVGLTYAGIWSCGGGTPANNNTGNLSNATAMTMLGASPTTGGGSLNFLAEDANGNAILAYVSPNASEAVRLAVKNFLIRQAMAQVGGCTCTATIDGSAADCAITDVSSTPGTGGSGTVATGIVIDNTGSMFGSDPAPPQRGLAASAAIDALAGGSGSTSSNMVFIGDFSDTTPATPLFSDIRQDQPWITLNSSGNVTTAKGNIVVEDAGSTNLYNSIVDVCADMKSVGVIVTDTQNGARSGHFNTAVSSSATIDGVSTKTMLILTDGFNNSGLDTVTDVVNCLQAGSGNDLIIPFVVGLGTSVNVSDLTTIANTNNGVFAQTTDASTLSSLFAAMVTASIDGFNTAVYDLTPDAGSGDTVVVTLTCGSASATATYTQP